MAIVKRTRGAELPKENLSCKEATQLPKAERKTSVEKWQEAREKFSAAGISEESFLKNPKYFTEKLRGAGIRPRKRKVLGDITYSDVETAIWSSQGSIAAVARCLRVSVYHVKSIFKRFKLLEQEFIEFKEAILDEVEDCLLTKIRMGDTLAMMFFLKCIGKERGYVERADTTFQKRGVKMKIVRAPKKKEEPSKPDNVLTFAKKAGNE